MKKRQFISILERYLKKEATAEEQNLLHAYYHLFMADSDVLLLLKDEEKERLKLQIKAEINKNIDEITINAARNPVNIVFPWKLVTGIAAAIAAITFGIWFYTSGPAPVNVNPKLAGREDIAPGKNIATLTVANGKTITLSDAKTGIVIGNNKLAYNDGSPVQENTGRVGVASAGGIQVLTASTPRGGTYQITLPDGTKVWLNAASSIIFPSTFTGSKHREVELNGEAYFEVFINKRQPFVVKSKQTEITVLGTHFNVNAYPDEHGVVKATLLEGSVRVSNQGSKNDRNAVVLKPNEQAMVTGNNRIKVNQVDATDAIDWKNGEFVFKGENLQSVMRRVARWYNVEVIYADDLPDDIVIGGYVSRSRPISVVLERMQKAGQIKFKISGNNVIVTKK